MGSEFEQRSYTLPKCHAVPRAKFAGNPVHRNVGGWDHAQSLAGLLRAAGDAGRQREVRQDQALLQRVFYRNRSQHRHGLYFRRLAELRRALRILDQAQVPALLERLLAAFFAPGAPRRERRSPGAWVALPCALFAAKAAGRVAAVARLASKTQQASTAVYIQFAAQTAQTLFMPLALVVQGLAARLALVAAQLHSDLAAVYRLLLAWLPHLPACPDSLRAAPVDLAAGLPPADALRLPMPLDPAPSAAPSAAAAAAAPAAPGHPPPRGHTDQEEPPRAARLLDRMTALSVLADDDIGESVTSTTT